MRQTTAKRYLWRKDKLLKVLELLGLSPPELGLLHELLTDHHHVSSLEGGERGEIDRPCAHGDQYMRW